MCSVPLWRFPSTKVVRLTRSHVFVYFNDTLLAKRAGCAITLCSGDSRTPDTQTRLNQFAAEFCAGAFAVTQRRNAWYVEYQGAAIPFTDGMQFDI
jgi:hypothetical protein